MSLFFKKMLGLITSFIPATVLKWIIFGGLATILAVGGAWLQGKIKEGKYVSKNYTEQSKKLKNVQKEVKKKELGDCTITIKNKEKCDKN